MQLRSYQTENITDIRRNLSEGRRSVLWQLPTGGGKTAGAAFMASRASANGKRVWFICHRRELLRQSSLAFTAAGIPHGLVAAGCVYDKRRLVHICGIDTLRRRLASVIAPDVIIWDECHHMGAASWGAVFNAFPKARHIGLSATPERLDGQGLGKFFAAMVVGPSTASLIHSGHLSPYRLFAPVTSIDLSGVHMQAGDFNRHEVNGVMEKPKVVGDAVSHYMKLALGRPTLLFAPSIEFSQAVAARFRNAGVPALHIDANTDQATRDAGIAALERNEIKVLCNVDLFGEGVSVNNVACIIQARPTCSLSLHLQQIGRGLRPFPGKADCVILDQVGNAMRHGLPDDEREWSLDGRDRKKKPVDPDNMPVKQCTQCYAINRAIASTCRECGFVFTVKARIVQEVEGDLAEVDPEVARAQFKMAIAKAADIEALIQVGRMKGMRFPERWAVHVLQARAAKQQRRSVV